MHTIDKIAHAICAELSRDGAVVWIGTDTGLRWLKGRLTGLGVDVTDPRILCLDAEHTLTAVSVEGMADTVRFAEVVGMQIDQISNRYAHVAIFAEMARIDVTPNAFAFGALLQSFAESRAVFGFSAYRAPVCRCEPTGKRVRNRWSVGSVGASLAIPITSNFTSKECM
jgi:hypothetical protein